MTTKSNVHELRNLTDELLLSSAAIVQDMRLTVLEFYEHVLSQLSEHPVTLPIRFCVAGLERMREGSLSVEILCLKNCHRDASIVLLSLLELRYDMLFVSRDPTRVEEWIDHTKLEAKPWKVRTQIDSLFRSGAEREAERDVYRKLSTIKHCNPAAKWLALPMSANRDALFFDAPGNDSPFIHLIWAGMSACLRCVGEASSTLLSGEGLDVGTFVTRLDNLDKQVSQNLERWVIETLSEAQIDAGS